MLPAGTRRVVRMATALSDVDGRAAALAELAALLGERLSTNPTQRREHGRGEAHHPPMPPDAVAFARSTEEVARIVRICARHRLPVIPFGAGTSLEGHVAAIAGGVSIDLNGMDRVVEVNAEDLDCRVEAGVRRKQLNTHLRDTGLFFPIDPGADATIGGMAATRASGTNAVRYGTMRDNVLGLTVVLADGRVVRTGGRARKSSAGYDLTRLLIGSEGTLGVITEIQLRLHGIPEATAAAVCAFPTVDDAVAAVILVMQSEIPVARIELLDEVQMRACIAYGKLEGYTAAPTLFLEFHGTPRAVEEEAGRTLEIAKDCNASGVTHATLPEDRNRLWQARHDAYYADLALRPGALAWATDVCVPISRLADCIHATRADVEAEGLMAPLVGHVGDGNFHLTFLVDPDRPEEMERAQAVNKRMVRRAIAMGGTCTGEHGVGMGKIDSVAEEIGEAAEVMRTIKRALDPDNILNPGKIVRV
jgi:D-lactate dehydrogenase (cytochrome)